MIGRESDQNTKRQVDKFREAARELETDESEEQFNRIVRAVAKPVQHASDCAVHAAPAYEPGPCDCGAIKAER